MSQKIETIRAIIENADARFFTVSFIKKNGEPCRINGHVYHSPKHNGKNTVAHMPQYLTVIKSKPDNNGNLQFRNVNLETVTRLACDGTVYNF